MENIDKNDIKYMCAFCFDTLLAQLNNEKTLPKLSDKYNLLKYPLFVTWYTGKSKDLRGCIGTFSEEALGLNLSKYALVSSLQDTRFLPIKLKEIPDLTTSVSLLTNFESISNPEDWEVGKHGIQIKFDSQGRNYGGTFLPQVASEQGWDQKTTLIYLVEKAGNIKLFSVYINKQ